MILSAKLMAAALVVSAPLFAGAAAAAPITAAQGLETATAPAVQTVQWRGRGWAGFGPGLAAGAIIGGGIAAATSPWGGYGYYGGYPAYGYDYGYAGAPDGYVTVTPGTSDPGYCARRFRSYDPASGTYLGYDGVRHPCP
jgi:hypothetical protein